MLSFDGLVNALSALVSLAFAAMVLSGRGRPAARGYLAAFLLLVTVNQASEFTRTLVQEASFRIMLGRVAAIAASLDPAALALFAAAYSRETSASRWALAAAAVGALLALWGGWELQDQWVHGRDGAYHAALAIYTMVTYTAILLWSIRRVRKSEGPRWWRPMAVALGALAIPTWRTTVATLGMVTFRPFFGPPGIREPLVYWVTIVVISVGLAFLSGILVARWIAPVAPRRAMLVGSVTTATMLLMSAHEIRLVPSILGILPYDDLSIVGRSSAPLRWLIFGGAFSVVVLRDEAMSLPPATRRAFARIVAALAALVAVTIAIALLLPATGSDLSTLPPLAWIALTTSLVLSQGFRSAIDKLAFRLAPAPTGLSSGRLALATGGLVAGRYRVEAMLGRGGGGRAFLALDEVLGRRVVLKELFGVAGDDAVVREARLAGGIQHPNVLTVFDVILFDDRSIIVSEFAQDGSLQDRLRTSPPDPMTGARLMMEVLDGLTAVHDAGILHRDLKPANVLLQAGRPKIADFGLAGLEGTRTAEFAATPRGTIGYAAPEQLQGKTATKATDVFAAGRILHVISATAPPAVAEVIDRAVAEDPAARYPDARAMREALAQALAHVQ